jgi:lysyl-tRNA synthetase class II
MKTIQIAETEYFQMQLKIKELGNKVAMLQDEQFIQKLQLAY